MLRLLILVSIALAVNGLTVHTNYTSTDYVWSFQDTSPSGAASWTSLPAIATTNVPAPTVATGVRGCLAGPCYDTRFLRLYPDGISAILNTVSNRGNTLGAALYLNTSGIRWV